MEKIVSLCRNSEFQRLYRRGRCAVRPSMVVYCGKGIPGGLRLGITAGKKVGGAVCRNRAKRVITAAFRSCLPQIKEGYDFVIVARTRILSVKSTDVMASLLKLLKKANLCCELQDENSIN